MFSAQRHTDEALDGAARCGGAALGTPPTAKGFAVGGTFILLEVIGSIARGHSPRGGRLIGRSRAHRGSALECRFKSCPLHLVGAGPGRFSESRQAAELLNEIRTVAMAAINERAPLTPSLRAEVGGLLDRVSAAYARLAEDGRPHPLAHLFGALAVHARGAR